MRNGVFGYKAHIIADVSHDIPLQMTVTTVSRNDSPLLTPLLSDLEKWCNWFRLANGVTVIADQGYDSRRNNRFVHRSGGIPIIHKRRLPDCQLHDGIYTTHGVPNCIGPVEIAYIRTDPETGCYLYRCPTGGCARRQTRRGLPLVAMRHGQIQSGTGHQALRRAHPPGQPEVGRHVPQALVGRARFQPPESARTDGTSPLLRTAPDDHTRPAANADVAGGKTGADQRQSHKHCVGMKGYRASKRAPHRRARAAVPLTNPGRAAWIDRLSRRSIRFPFFCRS